MDLSQLAKHIFALRNSDRPSQVIQPDTAADSEAVCPTGVLLLKPSSGHIPLASVSEILQRLVARHQYRIRSVTWWQGTDIKRHGLMSRHYPGFFDVAHGGFAALSPQARAALHAVYADVDKGAAFREAFNVPFDAGMVRTPYDLVRAGIAPDALNELWELDRSGKAPIRSIQRLDDNTFSLALELSRDRRIPPHLEKKVIVVLNGFFAKLEADFESHGCIAIWIERPPNSDTSWDELRSRFAGKTNPFSAPPGTVRGDAARKTLTVETVSILANVIHLSADEREGRREVEEVWWQPERWQQVFEPHSHA